MPRFAHMLRSAYELRGHVVTMWSPTAAFYRMFADSKHSKWAGYIDQYVLFPLHVRKALRKISADTLFVFCDQALGPWVPLVKSRPHVVHVHDLLALRSALGDIRENPTSFSGRIYQRFIRRGFRHARHFISVSKKTRDDLHRFGRVNAVSSDVVYNGLNFAYQPMARDEAHEVLRAGGFPVSPNGMLLSLGGSQWYKNQVGVVSIYAHYVAGESDPLPLWCIGPKPNDAVNRALVESCSAPAARSSFMISRIGQLQAAYSYARAFLFPSLAEGFGWPLVEAAACGCPVITTNEPPMNEVAGDAALYLPRLRYGEDIDLWASRAASILLELLSEPAEERVRRSERGRAWAMNFDANRSIEAYLGIYHEILRRFPNQGATDLGPDDGR